MMEGLQTYALSCSSALRILFFDTIYSMEKDLLIEVIQAEKDIQKQLALEEIRAKEWLERSRKECEAEFERERGAIEESARRSLEQAEQEADIKASDIVLQASRTAGRLAALSTEDLSRIVEKHIRAILPE